MASGVFRVFNIEREELSKVSILILQSVFMGIFAGAFDVGAQTMFLDVYSASLIPKAFAISGATGIIITSVYSFLQARLKYSNFAVINLVFIALCTLGLRLGFELSGDKRLVFAMFVLMGPLTIITFLGFWGTVSRLFTLRQGRRLFGMIDTGQIAGMILSFYTIPVLLSFGFRILNSLYLCAVSVILALIIQLFISSRYQFSSNKPQKNTEVRKSNFFDLFRSKYTSLMVIFVALSVFAAFFIHYSFLTVTEKNYTDTTGLASFLGVFMGTLMVFTLIIKTFVYGRIMTTYGLRLALLVSPVILGIFTMIALFVGNSYGYSAGSAGFTLFFLLIVSAKLISKSLKDAIEVPSSKILYQSLDSNIRYDVQARIDGTVNEVAAFSAGLIMAGIAISSFGIIHFTYVLVAILLLWLISGIALYRAYRTSLQYSLRKYLETDILEEEKKSITSEDLESLYNSGRLAGILNYVPQSWNGFISTNLEKLINSDKKEISDLTINWIGNLSLSESQNLLIAKEEKSESTDRSQIRQLINRFNLKKSDISTPFIFKLIRSEEADNRLKAVIAILKDPASVNPGHLLPLLRDNDFRVKVSTIRATGILGMYELAPGIIDLLDDDLCYPFAYSALLYMGKDIVDKLEQGFYRTGISEKGMLRIIKLISASGHPDTGKILMSILDSSGLAARTEILKSLLKISYNPGITEQNRLFQIMNEICSITAWNISVQFSIKENMPDLELYKAFDEELEGNFGLIFDILSLVYDHQLIYHIRKNLESGTSEGVGFAIELLDMFVDETVKPWLFPILEDRPVQSKIQSLQSEFPVEIYKSYDLINNILGRDYNKLSSFTRHIAINSISGLDNYVIGNHIIAQLFNPDEELAFAAAVRINSIDSFKIHEIAIRLPEGRYTSILNFLESNQTERITGAYEKYKILANSLALGKIKNRHLYQIAREFKTIYLNRGEDLYINRNLKSEHLIFIYKGILHLNTSVEEVYLKEGLLIRHTDILKKFGNDSKLKAGRDSVILILEERVLREYIFDKEFEFIRILDLIGDLGTLQNISKEEKII